MRRTLALIAFSMALFQGAAQTVTIDSVEATNVEKMDDKDSWKGKGSVEGLLSSDLNGFNSNGLTAVLIDANGVQDTVDFTGAECKLYGKGSNNLSCRQKGAGTLTLRFFESSTFTLGGKNHDNKNKTRVLTSKNETKDGWEESEFWKLSFKFFHRDFAASNLTAPLLVEIEGEGSATDDCTEKIFKAGRETIKCVPVEEE